MQDLPTVVLLFCSIFLFLFVLRTEREHLGTLALHQKLQSSPEFKWKDIFEKAKKNSSLDLQPLAPSTATQHPLEIVYSKDLNFLLKEPNKCQERNPFLVLLVVTKSKYFVARQAIKHTWRNENSVDYISMVCLFLSGNHQVFGSWLQSLLDEESSIHKDIIQQNFLDTYNNLTLKTLMGTEWISKFCPNAIYVMKADTDIFLNVNYKVSQLLQPHLTPDYMTGYIYRNTKPLPNKAFKWYVPWEIYSNDTYPLYTGGPGYIFSGDLVQKIYHVAHTIKVINMEGSFMGICLYELGINVTYSPWGLFKMYKISYEKCKFSKLVVVHHFEPEELLQIWPDFQDEKKICKN
ncbi:beta-1,3-galactosyltransferase 2-like [Crotalus tigris]|uniref:beta-1,3-galactosyltransferase 2-like n=1 Tax=Crotalus tigris TaxID=88082 RepID=UPI00192FA71C|nr:beta-1,3-galactosyltransferase 2-like [Crotalus tigris]